VSDAFLGKALAEEDMTEMRTAASADNLCADPITIRDSRHGTRDLVVKTRPSTARIEFSFRAIQRDVAAFADIRALLPEIVVFAAKGRLGSFANDDLFLFSCQRVIVHSRPPCRFVPSFTVAGT
jgi:hypothetical protein